MNKKQNNMNNMTINRNILKYALILIIIVFTVGVLQAQTVSTFLTNHGLYGPDGMTFDKEGNLYVANWGYGDGEKIIKISPEGIASIYLTGLSAPDGLVFDNDNNLYISNFASGIINKVNSEGVVSEYASGLNNPSSLIFDDSGNLYVSNHGNGSGTTISKISPDGILSTFASGFDAPLGLVFDKVGNLYVSNYNSGIIHIVFQDGVVKEFAKINNEPLARLQYLVFDRYDNLYVPSYGHNKIYKISQKGKVETYAGTGVRGSKDGSIRDAEFDGPNSIAINEAGDIYISEFNANRIRKITEKK